MALTLGEKLRQAREARDITISEVAEQTRISPLYIESIENDDYRTLPGGIFNKGFVKSYAKYVGVDEQEALQDYSKLIAEKEGFQGEDPKTYRPEVLTDDRSSSSMLPTILVAVVILGLMTVGILALVNYIQRSPSVEENADLTNTNSSQNANVAEPTPTPASTVAMGSAKIEFKTSKEPISLNAVNDGKKSNTLIKQDSPAVFQPQETLRLGFAKSLAPFAQLTINDRQIKLPTQPANPNRIPIEFEINKANIEKIFQSGEVTYENASAPR